MFQDRTNNSWSKRCLQFMVTIKNQSQPLLVHCNETKKKKKFSQILINTRLQLFYYYYYYFKVFHLFLQGLATVLQLLTSICSATTTRGRHKAWKSFSVGSSLHNIIQFTQGRPQPAPFSHRAAVVLPTQTSEWVHSHKKLSLLKGTVMVSAAEQSCLCVDIYIYRYIYLFV